MSKRGGYYVPVSMSDAMREALRHPMACGPDSRAYTTPLGDIGDLAKRVSEFEDELREAYRG